MPRAPRPIDEAERLKALQDYDVLDTPPEPAFDRIARIAARLFDVPTALISLVDHDRQWFKARVGLDATETGRDEAFCAHAILDKTVMVVPDAMRDERFMDNPLVMGMPGIKFYTGAPLITQDGYRIGTLCVVDTRPRRPPTDSDTAALADLADIVVSELDRRRERRSTKAGAKEMPPNGPRAAKSSA